MTATTSGFAIDWDTTHGDDESLSVSRGGGEAKVQLDKEGRREAAKSALLASDGCSQSFRSGSCRNKPDDPTITRMSWLRDGFGSSRRIA
jgi:hypothetical protein